MPGLMGSKEPELLFVGNSLTSMELKDITSTSTWFYLNRNKYKIFSLRKRYKIHEQMLKQICYIFNMDLFFPTRKATFNSHKEINKAASPQFLEQRTKEPQLIPK